MWNGKSSLQAIKKKKGGQDVGNERQENTEAKRQVLCNICNTCHVVARLLSHDQYKPVLCIQCTYAASFIHTLHSVGKKSTQIHFTLCTQNTIVLLLLRNLVSLSALVYHLLMHLTSLSFDPVLSVGKAGFLITNMLMSSYP